MLSILIIFFSLIILIIAHEFGHFILAKKFGVDVEEFGIGYPPRIIGKRIGSTIYSLNLLPFGAFVKIKGEEEEIEDLKSFSKKPIWQRLLIILGGVIAFWIVAAILVSIVAGAWGLPTEISDETELNRRLKNPAVLIFQVAPNSPAESAGIKTGDILKEMRTDEEKLVTDKVKEFIEFTYAHKGEKITLFVKRGKKIFETSLIPREFPPPEEGPIGVALTRIALKPYPWSKAPFIGILYTIQKTFLIPYSLGKILWWKITGFPIPKGIVQLKGIVGVSQMGIEALERGWSEFLLLIALVSILIAFFNLLPIPALDGGKILFLGIEAIRKKPISKETERKVTAFFFVLLIFLAVFITIREIKNLLK